MAIYRRFKVQQKYVNGQPTEEYRLGVEIDSTDYNSLEECNRGSDCTELEYRWVDVESADDYICDGTNKYKKQMKQQKCVTEEAWTNVYPYEYRAGDLIEHDSVDCGYSPTGEFHIYGTTDGHGSINISPSKEYYSSTDVVTITALPSTDYSFSRYNYGRNLNYGSVTYNSVLSLTMSHNWYVSAEYIDITPYYKIYPSTDGYGTLTFNPSQSSYRKGTVVTIIDKPSVNYVFSWFRYGSTIAYGTTAVKSSLKLNMTNDWYVSAVHSYVKPEYEGYLICGYADGTSKSYYWNKSTLTDGDFTTTLASDEAVTWVMNLDGCVKKIGLYGGHNFSWISLNGLEICSYANFYNCTSLQDIYLYGSKIVDFKSAKFYKDTERGPFFLYSAPLSLRIHVDCNNYGEYERLYSLVSRPRLILINDTNTYVYPFFIDHITCESVQPIISYTINISEVEGGKTIVTPSKEYYRQYDEVSIYALNSYNYSFKQLNYGENSEYSLSTSSSKITLFITQDWYIKPEFSTSYGENPNGLLYYNYRYASERWIPWSLPYLTSENTRFDIISCIDYGQTIIKISDMALSSIKYGSEYIGGYVSLPVCREIGSDGINIFGLTSLDAKQVEVIQDNGLASCEYLSGLDFPNLVAASYNAFFDTERITFVNMPKLKYCPGFFIGDINYSATLESMTLDNVLYFSGGFYRRTNLATFNAPNCKVFNGDRDTFIHTSIKSLNLPNCCLFSFEYNSRPYEQLTSLVLSDKFFILSYGIGYSSLLNISDANIGRFPEGWNNTQLTNGNCNVYGISSSSFATSDVIKSLEYINLDNCFYIGSKIFTNAHYISEIILKDCQIVSDQAFGSGSLLTKVDLRNAYHIGSSAFCHNPNLTDINVESVMILGQDAFKNCGMSVLSLPNAVWINNGITECKNLRDIYLNSSIKTTFSSDCFNGCNSNLLIHVPSSQYSRYCIEDGYNYISLYNENILTYNFVLLRNLLTSSTNLPELDKVMYYSYVDNTKSFIKPSMSILDSNIYNGQSAYIIDDYYGFITSLSYDAFAFHENLAYINLPSCNSIPESAFYSNKVLKYINAKNVEFIGSSAFASCSKLSNTITLNKCSYIGNNAFYNCSNLTSICLMSKSIVDFDPSTTFAYCNYRLKIYVPKTLLFDYITRYGSISVNLSGGTLYYSRILTTF